MQEKRVGRTLGQSLRWTVRLIGKNSYELCHLCFTSVAVKLNSDEQECLFLLITALSTQCARMC
jgi:hypothetical protein